jgi:hypothetical protein
MEQANELKTYLEIMARKCRRIVNVGGAGAFSADIPRHQRHRV